MRRLAVVALLFCSACTFRFRGLPIDDNPPDLAVPVGDDLALGVAADIAVDPCGPPLTPQSGALSVRCVIGDSPTLDGNLTEWGNLDYTLTHANAQAQTGPTAWTGMPALDNADCSAQFSLRWDLSYLWVAVHVDDDIRGLHPNQTNYAPYLDDAIELYLDGLDNRTKQYGPDDAQLIVTADGHNGLFKDGQPAGPLPAGEFAVRQDLTGAGYSVEFRVPWSALGVAPVVNGRVIGVDFLVDDDDNVTVQELTRYLTWWNMTSGGCGSPADCTSNFGVAQLVGR